LNEPSPEGPADFKTLDTALSFAGLWVNEAYIANIHKTRSPRQSQDVMESCITIPSRTLQVTRMVAGFHEGAEDLVVVKDRDRYKLYDADLSALQKEMELISPTRISVNMGSGKGKDYGYRFKGDTLQIFRTICATAGGDGNFCDSLTAGATLYKLVRKKD